MAEALDDWRRSGRTFQFRGHTIFYQRGGRGGGARAVLCIHGLPTASWDFQRIWTGLTARNSLVLAPDMLGFGFSQKPPEHNYSIAEQADLHELLLREHGVTHVRILAHDYGVSVAQEMLARHEERLAQGDATLAIEGVCFLNGGLFPESHRPLLIQRMMLTPLGPLLSRTLTRKSFGQNFSKVFGPRTKPSSTELDAFWQLASRGGGKRMFYRLFHYIPERLRERERWVGALQRSRLPMRLINGPADPVSGAHLVARYRALIAAPDIVVLSDIGHYPHVEAPEAVLLACEPIL